jgi:hypothetical protein
MTDVKYTYGSRLEDIAWCLRQQGYVTEDGTDEGGAARLIVTYEGEVVASILDADE